MNPLLVWPVMAAITALGLQGQVARLDGEQISGHFVQLDREAVALNVAGEDRTVPLGELLEVRVTDRQPVTPAETPLATVTLIDGSQLHCQQVQTDADICRCQSKSAGPIEVPLVRVAHIRLGAAVASQTQDWSRLLEKESRRDLLVVRRDNGLDFYDGVVGQIAAASVAFLLDGDEVPVGREKVFGVIYFRRPQDLPEAACELKFADGSRLSAMSVVWNDSGLQATLRGGDRLELKSAELLAVDYSAGKIAFLSELEPRAVDYTPFFDTVWEYRRNRSLDGGPIRLDGESYQSGLAIHSRTRLQYRLGRKYRQFKAVMGIDDAIQSGLGSVNVVIRGDDRVLLEAIVEGGASAVPLDLDVTNVLDLEILVDFGDGLDIGDHLDLANARVIK